MFSPRQHQLVLQYLEVNGLKAQIQQLSCHFSSQGRRPQYATIIIESPGRHPVFIGNLLHGVLKTGAIHLDVKNGHQFSKLSPAVTMDHHQPHPPAHRWAFLSWVVLMACGSMLTSIENTQPPTQLEDLTL